MSKIETSKENINDMAIIVESPANSNRIIDEWIRFMPTITEEGLKFIKQVDNQEIYFFDEKNYYKYLDYKEQLEFPDLFKKYKNNECTPIEKERVVEYINTRSLKELMQKRLGFVKLSILEANLSELKESGLDKIVTVINSLESHYNTLDLNDAYMLFCARELLYDKLINECMTKIEETKKEETKVLIKKYVSDLALGEMI